MPEIFKIMGKLTFQYIGLKQALESEVTCLRMPFLFVLNFLFLIIHSTTSRI